MENVTYNVCEMNVTRDSYETEAEAIAAGERIGSDLASVIMVVISGTHRSETQVWPEVKSTYSN